MKTMEKILLSLVLALSLAACAAQEPAPSGSAREQAPASSAAASGEAGDSRPESSGDSRPESSGDAAPSSQEPEASAPSSEPEPPAAPQSDAGGELAGLELFDNQFLMDGAAVTMPAPVSAMAQFGLAVPADKGDYMLNPNTMTGGELESADGTKRVFVGFYNRSDEVVKLSESDLNSVTLKQKELGGSSVTLAKGIAFGSTMDEVKAAYGEPDSFIDGDPSAPVLRERMKYKNPEDSANFYELSFEDKQLVGVELYVRG